MDGRNQTRARSALPALDAPSRGVSAISGHLRRAIESGTYSDGDQLPPERQLAASFRTARSTVRRALDQLERAGLVSRRLGAGTFVTVPPPHAEAGELSELISPLQLIEARFAVEPYTTRLAVLNATRRDLDEMGRALEHAEHAGDDKDAFSRWDAEFHLLIATASRNPLLQNVYTQINTVRLHAQWDAMKEQILTAEVIRAYNLDHRGIYQALYQRDAQLAQARITEHLERARDDLLRADST
jgi:DNA-binding FadR family transcriptional regulator